MIQDVDSKVKSWNNTSAWRDLTVIQLRTGRFVLWDFLSQLSNLRNFEAIVFRYLNDLPSFWRNTVNWIAELLVMGLARVLQIEVIWLCHNVDRESVTRHPRTSKLRRRLAAKLATKIYVTDPLLTDHATRCFGRGVRKKVDWTTFGKLNKNFASQDKLKERVMKFYESKHEAARRSGKTQLMGLVAGSTGDKMLHFDYATTLLRAAEHTTFEIGLVIVGPVYDRATPEQVVQLEKLATSQNVLFLPEYLAINEYDLASYIDFFWRGYRDYSMSYTLYVAASIEKPVLALNTGFVAEAVDKYGLGAITDPLFTDFNSTLNKLLNWDSEQGKKFLETHSWEIGASRLRSGDLTTPPRV